MAENFIAFVQKTAIVNPFLGPPRLDDTPFAVRPAVSTSLTRDPIPETASTLQCFLPAVP